MTATEQLLQTLRSDDPTLRQRAAMQLGTVETGAFLGELVRLMAAEPDDFVRETLIWAVVANKQAAVPHLVEALYLPELPAEPLLHALSKIGDPSAVPAILPFADHDDAAVAAKAWWALGRTGAGLPQLIAHLGERDAARYAGLTRALLQFGDAAVPALEEALRDDDRARRAHAAAVLVRLADPEQYTLLERRGGSVGADAETALVESDAEQIEEALTLAAHDPDRPSLGAVAKRVLEARRTR